MSEKSCLVEASLFQVNLDEALLIEANLSLAMLHEVSLKNANLERAIFCETNLEDVDLTGARIAGSNFWSDCLFGTITTPEGEYVKDYWLRLLQERKDKRMEIEI